MSLVGNPTRNVDFVLHSWIFKLSLFTKTVLETEPYPIQANLELLQASKPLKFAEKSHQKNPCQLSFLTEALSTAVKNVTGICLSKVDSSRRVSKQIGTNSQPAYCTNPRGVISYTTLGKQMALHFPYECFLNSPLTPTVTLSSRLFFGG